MRWTPRVIGCTAALLGVACVTIAGLEPIAEQLPEQRPSQPESNQSEPPAGQRPQDASVTDARADAGDAGKRPSCKNEGEAGCRQHADCCSGECREDGVCVRRCQKPPPAGGTCPVGGDPDCCIGFWCGGGSLVAATCTPCVPAGQPVGDDHFRTLTPRSCCSRKAVNGICQ